MKLLGTFRAVTWLVVVTLVTIGVVMPTPSSAQVPGAQLTITGGGKVKIDGIDAATGSTVFTGSRISTESGVTAVVTTGGTRLTLQPETDATVLFAGSFVRADVICGVANGDPAPGSTLELITHGDTSVYAAGGTLRVDAEGRTFNMSTNQTQTFEDGVHIFASGGSSFEASSILCSCLCAAPVIFPPIVVAGFPLALISVLIPIGAAAIVVPVVLTSDDDNVVVSNPFPG